MVRGVADPWWNDDDQLLAAVGDALRAAGETPRRLVEIGKAAFVWRDIESDLAALTYDSAASEPDPRLVGALRGTESATLRAMTFVASRLTIELELTSEALLGQVTPFEPGEVDLWPAHGAPRPVPIDEVGWFAVRPLPTGPFRLHVRTGAGSVLTDWITL